MLQRPTITPTLYYHNNFLLLLNADFVLRREIMNVLLVKIQIDGFVRMLNFTIFMSTF